jgi:hypothetical protein
LTIAGGFYPGKRGLSLALKPREFRGVRRLAGFGGLGEAALNLLGPYPEFLGAILRTAGGFPEHESVFANAGLEIIHAGKHRIGGVAVPWLRREHVFMKVAMPANTSNVAGGGHYGLPVREKYG